MRSGSVSVHLVLDSKSVYNANYDENKLQLALAHGTKLVNEFDRKIACSQSRKTYQPAAFVEDILQEMQTGMPALNAEEAVLERLKNRSQALSAIPCKNSESSKTAKRVLIDYQEDMDKGYANFVTRLPASLQNQLFLQSNQGLLRNIQHDAARGATVFIANGTPRQFMSHNAFEFLVHDTGCLFKDLQALVTHMRSLVKNPESISLDAFSLHDAIFDLPVGDHFKNLIGSITQFDYYSECAHIDFVSTYLHAQYHALHHGDVPIEMHCYVSTDEAVQKLQAQIIKYHDRFPKNVNILVTKYCGDALEAKACIGSADQPDKGFRHHAKKMHQALTDTALTELENPEDQYYVAMLDADNCIYNGYYYMLLVLLIEKFGDRLVASQNLDRKSEEAVQLSKEMLEFVQSYPRKKLLSKAVNYKMVIASRKILTNKFAELPLDEDILAMRDAMLKGDKNMFDNNAHGPVFYQFIRILASYTPDIMTTVILRANERLFADMKKIARIENANKIALLISSMRQSYRSDLLNAVWNGTGRFHLDLSRITTMLNNQAEAGDPMFEYDDVTLVDYQYGYAPGCHVGLSTTEFHKTLENPRVDAKLDTFYKDLHHAKRRYRVSEIEFFDDSIRVFEAIEKAYGKKDTHGLLPAGMKANLVGYNGKYMKEEFTITGRGVVDQHPYDMFYYICGTTHGYNALVHGQLDSLPYGREQARAAEMNEFIELTRWSQPDEFFAPARAKTIRKISRAMQILEEEIERFSACSGHVKHGMYAGHKAMHAGEIAELLHAMKHAKIQTVDGLEKIMGYTANHKSIYDAAKKLRDLIHGANEQQYAHMQMTGLGKQRYV